MLNKSNPRILFYLDFQQGAHGNTNRSPIMQKSLMKKHYVAPMHPRVAIHFAITGDPELTYQSFLTVLFVPMAQFMQKSSFCTTMIPRHRRLRLACCTLEDCFDSFFLFFSSRHHLFSCILPRQVLQILRYIIPCHHR